MAGKLYICATPIGNLSDITLRALETLKSVDLIAAEDTRHTRQLLTHFDIHTPLTSYHEHNRYEKAAQLVGELLAGRNIAQVSDAGTPVISDPGEELVRQAVQAGIEVVPLPGACALITALSVSGIPGRRFAFEGFLPRGKKERAERLAALKNETRTLLFYEAPHHLKETLADLETALGDRPAALCRELTKVHEEVLRLNLSRLQALYREEEPRGEYVLVVEGRSGEALAEEAREAWESLSLEEHVARYTAQGLSEKEAIRQAAKDRGLQKREVYNALKASAEEE